MLDRIEAVFATDAVGLNLPTGRGRVSGGSGNREERVDCSSEEPEELPCVRAFRSKMVDVDSTLGGNLGVALGDHPGNLQRVIAGGHRRVFPELE